MSVPSGVAALVRGARASQATAALSSLSLGALLGAGYWGSQQQAQLEAAPSKAAAMQMMEEMNASIERIESAFGASGGARLSCSFAHAPLPLRGPRCFAPLPPASLGGELF